MFFVKLKNMARIIIKNLNNRIIWAINNNSCNVLNIIHENNIDWMYSCGGKGRCTTCKMNVLEGEEHLSALSLAEISFYDKGQLGPGERLACQSYLNGDVVIQVPTSSKFPHVTYSD